MLLGMQIGVFVLCLMIQGVGVAAQNAKIALIGADPTASADGTVPEWSGGLVQQSTNERGHHDELYADEKPLFIIDINNYLQHKERLSPGQIALLTNYPDSFRIPVYQSHRTTSFPDWFYQNMENIQNPPTLTDGGNGINNGIAGVNFPKPNSALEVIWNHLTRWRGLYINRMYTQAIVYPNGQKKLGKSRQQIIFDLFLPDTDAREDKYLLHFSSVTTEPASKAGGALLVIDHLNQHQQPRHAWSYDAGQRRVKRMPSVSHDDPMLDSDGLRTADELDMYNGSPDRYDWKLLGKRIMYIPYNSYQFSSPDVSYEELLTPYHINPEMTRFEAHRVWVVEANLKPGMQHIYHKRVFYLDEDSWSIAIIDQYDRNGKIWRVSMSYLKHYYEVQVPFNAADVYHDLKLKQYHVIGLTNEERNSGVFSETPPPLSYFTPAALRVRANR